MRSGSSGTMPSILAQSYVDHILADNGAALFTPEAKVRIA